MTRRPRSQATTSTTGGVNRVAVSIAIAWSLLFAAAFLSRPLEHQSNLRRVDVLLLLPDLLSETFTVGPEDLPSGVRFLPQRMDLFATALFLGTGLFGIGRLALRGIAACSVKRTTAGRHESRDEATNAGGALPVDRLEWNLFAFGLGIAAWSLFTLACGLAGWLSRPLFVGTLLTAIAVELFATLRDRRAKKSPYPAPNDKPSRRALAWALVVVAPFLVATVLGSMLPPYAFDVKEYHLGGPKEWYLDGRIAFLPHNVYTNFPALTEMLSLSSMVVRGDWFRGALAGKLLLAGFFPMTGAVVYATGRRLFGSAAGLMGAIVYLTIPWTYQLSVIAYVEGGLSAFLAMSLLALVVSVVERKPHPAPSVVVFVAGVFAGSAMACKYPGAVQVVLPLGAAVAAIPFLSRSTGKRGQPEFPKDGHVPASSAWSQSLRVVGLYATGVAIAVGPWLVKNTIDTGNPVYPLLWTVFDGTDWNADLNEKWRAAHSPPNYRPATFLVDLQRVVHDSSGQSLLVFGMSPLAFLGTRRRVAGWLWIYVAYLFVTWWLLTHRIDRFWVPMLPVVCVLSGAGAVWSLDRSTTSDQAGTGSLETVWRFVRGIVFAIAILFSVVLLQPQQPPSTKFLSDLAAAERAAATPGIAVLNRMLPADACVLLVGEAEIFDARFSLFYNTVFDENLFEAWTREPRSNDDAAGLRSDAHIRQTFADRGVTHLYVNWREIVRYRTTYGFTSFVVPERFSELQRRGVLQPESLTIIQAIPFDSLSPDQQREAEANFPSLIRGHGPDRMLVAAELYTVRE